MKNLTLGLLFLTIVLASGCITIPPQDSQTPDQNQTIDYNAFGSLLDVNRFLTGDKPISINFDENKIFLNFDYNLSTENKDLNVLTEACSLTCSVIDANSWSLKLDVNFSSFNCYCTKQVCTTEEQSTQIIKYCSDKTIGFAIRNQES